MHIIVIAGIWTAPLPLHSEETWIHHVLVQHPGVVAFLFFDSVVLTAAATLTTVQASQVIDQRLHDLRLNIFVNTVGSSKGIVMSRYTDLHIHFVCILWSIFINLGLFLNQCLNAME